MLIFASLLNVTLLIYLVKVLFDIAVRKITFEIDIDMIVLNKRDTYKVDVLRNGDTTKVMSPTEGGIKIEKKI